MINELLVMSDEVGAALASGKPVVALESTIISHGMPYPRNVETALEVERIVRENGAIPATIAVLGGKLRAGLSEVEIDHLGKKGLSVMKVSRRDIPSVVAAGADGATTVAATMIVADMAGIRVFCTGGIGGVHRGAESTMDISADLEELAKTPVMVVCAGAKSILDIGLTLEYLETRGVPVYGFGTEHMPAFYTRTSGFKLAQRVDSFEQAAANFAAQLRLGFRCGAVVANPIPHEFSIDEAFIADKISAALVAADREGVKGKDITPFLLASIVKATEGKSLDANIQLVFNNARVASGIAAALAGEVAL
jgi:pseudouridine-5'-phosphate glycosidase